MDRWIGEWCRYNFAAGSFHTRKLCSWLLSTEVEFYWQKQQNRVLCHTLGDLEVHVSSVARWKALAISANLMFFVHSHSWGAMSSYWSKSWCSKGGWSLWVQIFWRGEEGVHPPMTVGLRKLPGLSRGFGSVILRLAALIQYRTGMWQTHTHTGKQTHNDG